MENSYDILVIILSIAFGFLLLLAIIFMVFLIRTIRAVNKVTEKAESIVNNVDMASRVFQKSAGPVAVTKVVANIVEMFREEKPKKRKGKK